MSGAILYMSFIYHPVHCKGLAYTSGWPLTYDIFYVFPGSIQRRIYAQPLRSAVTDICEDMAGLKLSSEDSCQSKGCQNEHLVRLVLEVIQEMTDPFKDTYDLQSQERLPQLKLNMIFCMLMIKDIKLVCYL